MMSGPISRKRRSQRGYVSYAATLDGKCDFCQFSTKQPHVLRKTKHFWVVQNIFGYDVWDGLSVKEHLLLVPRKHHASIAQFKPAEQAEYLELIKEHEVMGYSLYSRSTENITRSVHHQHTHFLKLDTQRKKILFYLRKPHFLFAR